MIELTRFNGARFYVNAEHIQTVEASPDTHVVLTNGQQMLVRESADEVAERAVCYYRRVRGYLRVVSGE